MGLSRLSKACRECKYKDTCNNKRMEAVGYLSNAAPLTVSNAAPLTAAIIQPYDYRNIKIGEETTVTIDLEEIKKKLKEQFTVRTCHL